MLSTLSIAGAAQADLRRIGQPVIDYRWSGYLLTVALCYLQERQGADLLHSEHDAIATAWTKASGVTHIILTRTHRDKFTERLSAETSEKELCDYYNEFNSTSETDAGKPMADSIRALRDALVQIETDSVIALVIG